MKILLTALGAGVTGALICKVLAYETSQIAVVAMLCFTLVGMAQAAALGQRAPAPSSSQGSVVLLRSDEKVHFQWPPYESEAAVAARMAVEAEIVEAVRRFVRRHEAAQLNDVLRDEATMLEKVGSESTDGDARIALALFDLARQVNLDKTDSLDPTSDAGKDYARARDVLAREVTPGEANLVCALLDAGVKFPVSLSLISHLRSLGGRNESVAGKSGVEVREASDTTRAGGVDDQGKNGVEVREASGTTRVSGGHDQVTKGVAPLDGSFLLSGGVGCMGRLGDTLRVQQDQAEGGAQRDTSFLLSGGLSGMRKNVGGLDPVNNGAEHSGTHGQNVEGQATCPTCGPGTFVVPIIYGGPAPGDAEAVARGEIELGGCVLPEGKVPTHRCKACGGAF